MSVCVCVCVRACVRPCVHACVSIGEVGHISIHSNASLHMITNDLYNSFLILAYYHEKLMDFYNMKSHPITQHL